MSFYTFRITSRFQGMNGVRRAGCSKEVEYIFDFPEPALGDVVILLESQVTGDEFESYRAYHSFFWI
jgi:hypothetical protein